jgi:hypothetical protein
MNENTLWRIFRIYVAFSALTVIILGAPVFMGWSRQSHELLTAVLTILFSIATVGVNWLAYCYGHATRPEPTLSELDKGTEEISSRECDARYMCRPCELEKGHDGEHHCNLGGNLGPRYWP